MNIRVGFGFDVHQFSTGRKCIIGGVEISHEKGPLGHSDADVLLHAVCDALLGAAGLKDIGTYFPDTSTEFKNANSRVLLKKCLELVREKGYRVGNIDSSLCLEAPKLLPHIDQMKLNISSDLGIHVDEVSIKATTNEKMGFIGREEGLVAYAVVLLIKD